MKTIAVIGLGPSGLAAIKELKAKGFEVVGFDGQESIGGLWAAPGRKHGIYRELTLNSGRSFTEFSDFPWNKEDYSVDVPDEGGVFASGVEFLAYLKAYAKHFELESSFRLKTVVKCIERRSALGGYVVTTISSSRKEEITHSFDAVVVCTGRHIKPNHPLVDTTFKIFSGKVLHSQDVKSLADFDGRRVLVVGASVSGTDSTASLAKRGKCAALVNSVRKVPIVLDIFNTNGESLEYCLFTRLGAWLNPHLPEEIGVKGFKAEVLKNFPDQITEEITKNPKLVPNDDLRISGAAYCSGYVEAAKKGLFTIKPAVESVSGSSVTFQDESSQSFDVIVCCTGYQGCDLNIVPQDVCDKVFYTNPTGFVEPALYKRTLIPHVTDMAFIGINGYGGVCPVSEIQARYVAALWHDDIPRPSESKIAAGIKAFKLIRNAGPHNKYDLAVDIQEQLGAELGVIPSIAQVLCNPSKLLVGKMFPSYYRTHRSVDGEEVAAKALERWEWCHEHPPIREDTTAK